MTKLLSTSLRPRFTAILLALGLLLLAFGYWGAWLDHPVSALNILGIDLAEFVKFVPEVQSEQIALQREVFFNPLLTLAAGLILFAAIRGPNLPRWLRFLAAVLAIPAALAMLPPAWTPALLRTPEFRTQMLYILFLLIAVVLTPLLYRILPGKVHGLLLLALGILPFPALFAYLRLQPALETLYQKPVQPGIGLYLIGLGAILVGISGLVELIPDRS